MKIRTWIPCSLMGLLLAVASAPAQADDEAAAPSLRLPAGMARADQPQQVAALYNEENQERAKVVRPDPQSDQPSPQEAYNQKLIAYRTQLVEEQRQRKIKELELEIEREARQRAQQEAMKAEAEREREALVQRHQAIHIYHEWIQRGNWQRQHVHQPCPRPSQPQTCPSTLQATASIP